MDDLIYFHDLIWFFIIGGLMGWLASLLPNDGGLGVVGDMVIGISGAFVGGFLAEEFDVMIHGFWGVLGMAVLGAAILLAVLRIVFRPEQMSNLAE